MIFARERVEKALEDIKERRRCNYTWLGSPPFMNQIRVLEDVDFLLKLLAELQANLEKAKAALKTAWGFVDAHDNVGFARVTVRETLAAISEGGEREG